MWKRFLQNVVSFSSVKNLFFKFLKLSNFKFQVSSFKCVKEIFSHYCKFQVKSQACVIGLASDRSFFLSSLCEGSKISSKVFNLLRRVFVVAFVFKMSSFQMESLKVMEKFDGGNFHLWKFKMRMMLSKHGLWKFVDGSVTLPSEEVARADYNTKETKALHCFVNISRMPNLHTFNIVTM